MELQNSTESNQKLKTNLNILHIKWRNMLLRCENPKNSGYKNYGGRGIKVCDRWHDYKNFQEDLLESFIKHIEIYGLKETTLDRIDVNGNYEPNNVRWATKKEQANNRRNNRMVAEDLNCTQLVEKYELNYGTTWNRLNKGWSIEKILDTPAIKNVQYYLPCGVTLYKHCIVNGYCEEVIRQFIINYSIEPHEALAKYLENKQSNRIARTYKHLLPCNNTLYYHCMQNGYNYKLIVSYISKYNLNPHEALAKYLSGEKFKYAKYYITNNNKSISLREYCEQNNCDYEGVLYYIIRYKMSPNDALTKYMSKQGNTRYFLPCNNGTMPLKTHCIQNNYSYTVVTRFIKKYNLEPHEALARHLKSRQKKNSRV